MSNYTKENGDKKVVWVCLGCIAYIALYTTYNIYTGQYSKRALTINEHSICEQVESEVESYSRDEVACVNGLKFSRLYGRGYE